MTDDPLEKKLPCVEQPLFQAFDSDGDGVLNIDELREAAPTNAQLQQIVEALEANGVAGLRYTGCDDDVNNSIDKPSGAGTMDEDIALIIARAAVSGDGHGRN